MANYTGHCVDTFLGRPLTAPAKPALEGDALDEAKRTWDKQRFGEHASDFGDVQGRYSMTARKQDRASGVRHTTYNDNPKTHPLIKNENHVLEYRAVYEEKVRTEDGSHIEPHDCLLRYFVEDGTMEIIEKPVANSGRTEFRLVKRAQIHNANDPDNVYTAEDLMPGMRVVAYGMAFKIVNGTKMADDYMNTKFGGYGFAPPMDMGSPTTPMFDGMDPVPERATTADLTTTRKERTQALLTQQDFAQQVDNVCLDLLWDDSDALYGDVHELKLKYYLLDDAADVYTVESRKFEAKYSGSRAIVKRQKLVKQNELSAPLQGLDSRMRLTSAAGGRHKAPKQQYVDSDAPGNFFHWSEMLPGTHITVLGRKAQVVGFGNLRTERFYRKMMGDDLVDEVRSKYRIEMVSKLPVYRHPIPEHVGYGSHEDSMRSVKNITPKAPPGASGVNTNLRYKLQFKGKLVSSIPSDQTREFIISFFCEDGTLTIFESSPRNSGRASYTFAARAKYIATYDPNNGNQPIYYAVRDMYVGCPPLVVNGHHFELIEAAAGTITFLQTHSDKF